MAEKLNKEVQVINTRSDGKTVWSSVAGAAVDYMESRDEGMTKDEIVQGVIDSNKAALVPKEKIEELVESVLTLFVGNGILVNNAGVYVKRTIQDTPTGKMMAQRGIEIERKKKDGKKKD